VEAHRTVMQVMPWLDEACQLINRLSQPLTPVASLFMARILFDMARASSLVPLEMLPPPLHQKRPTPSRTPSLTRPTTSELPSMPSLSAERSSSSSPSTSLTPLSSLTQTPSLINAESPLEAELSRGLTSAATQSVGSPATDAAAAAGGIRQSPSALLNNAWQQWSNAEALGLDATELATHLLTSLECRSSATVTPFSSSIAPSTPSPSGSRSIAAAPSASSSSSSSSSPSTAAATVSGASDERVLFAIRGFGAWSTAMSRLRTSNINNGSNQSLATKLISSLWPSSLVAAQQRYVQFLRFCLNNNGTVPPTRSPLVFDV
jgi:hypothetical protein